MTHPEREEEMQPVCVYCDHVLACDHCGTEQPYDDVSVLKAKLVASEKRASEAEREREEAREYHAKLYYESVGQLTRERESALRRASEAERTFADLRAGMQKIVAENALLARSAEGADRALELAVVRWTLTESERDEAVRERDEARATYPKPEAGWTCFHCGETFTNEGAARDHFGQTPIANAGCLIRVQLGDERGLLMELRKAEEQLTRYHAEDSDTIRAMIGMKADHVQALIREEEKGYNRGVTDMRAERDEARAALGKVVEERGRLGCALREKYGKGGTLQIATKWADATLTHTEKEPKE